MIIINVITVVITVIIIIIVITIIIIIIIIFCRYRVNVCNDCVLRSTKEPQKGTTQPLHLVNQTTDTISGL